MKELKGHIYHKKRKWKCRKCGRVRMQEQKSASRETIALRYNGGHNGRLLSGHIGSYSRSRSLALARQKCETPTTRLGGLTNAMVFICGVPEGRKTYRKN